MIRTVVELHKPGFHWVDIVEPSPREFEEIAERYGLHPTSVQDCLQPEHLPKGEQLGEIGFIITRAYDEASTEDADTVQELTRKIALFVGKGWLITIHRKDQPFLGTLREKWGSERRFSSHAPALILADILRGAIRSYEGPIDRAVLAFEDFETRIFRKEPAHLIIPEIYFLKRKASVFKRVLHLTLDALPKLSGLAEDHPPLLEDLKDEAHRLAFYADELAENVNNLLNLHVALASHRTNEVMRVLTVLSVFFLPLTFIVGVYGMNFDVMPELGWKWGYPAVLVFMAGVTLWTFLWARRKGYLR